MRNLKNVFYSDIGHISDGNWQSMGGHSHKDGDYVWDRHCPNTTSLKELISLAKIHGDMPDAKAGILVIHFMDDTQKVYFFKNNRRDKTLQ